MTKEKLYFVANARMPTEKAHGVHIANMCCAFAKCGFDVMLVIPARQNDLQNVFEYYGVEHNFSVERLPTVDLIRWHVPFAFRIQTFAFGLAALRFLRRRPDAAIVYTRGEMALFLAGRLREGHSLFWETHIKPRSMQRYRRVWDHVTGFIVVTKKYFEELKVLMASDRLLFEPDGVDIGVFSDLPTRDAARAGLGIGQETRLAVYTGSDLPWKGLESLKRAAPLLPEGWSVAFVGDIKNTDTDTTRALFVGHRPYTEMPTWLAAADCVVLTGTKRSEVSSYYTSPLKLFEYMASGRPIVASDIPSFRDILNERNAFLVTPDDPAALAGGIMRAAGSTEGRERAEAARRDVARYDWTARAERIRDFMQKRVGV